MAGVPGRQPVGSAAHRTPHPAACAGSPGASRSRASAGVPPERGQQHVRERVLLLVCRRRHPAGVGGWHPQTRPSGGRILRHWSRRISRGAPANRRSDGRLSGSDGSAGPLRAAHADDLVRHHGLAAPPRHRQGFHRRRSGIRRTAQSRLPTDPTRSSSAESECMSRKLAELQEERRQRTRRHLLGHE